MKRREFVTLVGGSAITWPLSVRAEQSDRVQRIAVLIQLERGDQDGQNRLSAFQDELQKLGWIVGKNPQIDYRWSISDEERGRLAAADLLKLKPDLIFANATPALRAAQQATSTIPIVFTTVIDPVGQGFVASLAHPGGNTTGFSALEPSVGGKWLDLLKQIAPGVTRVAFMYNPQRGPYGVRISTFVQEASQKLAVQYNAAPVFEPVEIEKAITVLASEPGGGLIVSPDAFTANYSKLFIDPDHGAGSERFAARFVPPFVP